MKKILYSTLIVCLSVVLLCGNLTAFAEDRETQPMWQDITLTREEFDGIMANNPNNNVSPCATGLITLYLIAVEKSGNTLIITGKTYCSSSVVKCGFKEVVIQRRVSSTASWNDYQSYTDLYVDSNNYTLSKSITVPIGYQYRVTCIHYAKKNILSTQKIDNTSNIV